MFGVGRSGGCRRCSRCSIHYPPAEAFKACEVCDEATSYFSNVEPDPEWKEAVRYAKMHPPERVGADPHVYRFEEYLKMGFNEHQSQKLALATWGALGMPLYHQLVRQALDAGCDHHLAFDMFS